jgi:hypothetical protein
MNEIEKASKQELAWNKKPVRITEEEATAILGPMFAAFPNTNADDATFEIYIKMLRDLDPETLAQAVLKAMNTCKFLPTVAEIREQIETRAPGPWSDVDMKALPPLRLKYHRLDPEEDKRQRMAQLRRTQGWRYDA